MPFASPLQASRSGGVTSVIFIEIANPPVSQLKTVPLRAVLLDGLSEVCVPIGPAIDIGQKHSCFAPSVMRIPSREFWRRSALAARNFLGRSLLRPQNSQGSS